MRHLDTHLYHDELITALQILKIVDVRFYPKIFWFMYWATRDS